MSLICNIQINGRFSRWHNTLIQCSDKVLEPFYFLTFWPITNSHLNTKSNILTLHFIPQNEEVKTVFECLPISSKGNTLKCININNQSCWGDEELGQVCEKSWLEVQKYTKYIPDPEYSGLRTGPKLPPTNKVALNLHLCGLGIIL